MTHARPSSQLNSLRQLPPGPPLKRERDWWRTGKEVLWTIFMTLVVVLIMGLAYSVVRGA
jgi:hypothetical protein